MRTIWDGPQTEAMLEDAQDLDCAAAYFRAGKHAEGQERLERVLLRHPWCPKRLAMRQRLLAARGLLSQRALGKVLGVNPGAIARAETKGNPGFGLLVAYGERAGINLNWLLLGEGRMRR